MVGPEGNEPLGEAGAGLKHTLEAGKSLGAERLLLQVRRLRRGLGGSSRGRIGRRLGELALEFASAWMQPGGDLVVKAFQGEGFAEFRRNIEARFAKVYVRKPKASRDRSREVYLVAKGLKS